MHFLVVLDRTEWFFFFLATFILGCIIGSFLNVVIHRLPLGESIVFPNSQCPRCHQKIAFYDNLPILSWLILRGKCRKCHAPISIRYPSVEVLTGAIFAVFFWFFSLSYLLPVYLTFAAAIIALIFIDAEHMILPDKINYPALVCALLIRLWFGALFKIAYFDDLNSFPLNVSNQPLWVKSLIGATLGALIGGGSLWFVGFLYKHLRGIDAMGLGDVKMMLWVGALLGWRLTILTIFLAALSGAVCGIGWLKLSKDKNYQTQIPFGVFLGLGALVSVLCGTQIIDWYLKTFVYR